MLKNTHKNTIAIVPGVPPPARALIWDIFFASRHRGLDLTTHFPWIEQDAGVYCVLFRENNGSAIASLVLRQIDFALGVRYAMIGMVCVDPVWRGRGLCKQLLASAVAFASQQDFPALVLWTGQPHIYSAHGFRADGQDTFGTVTLGTQLVPSLVRFSRFHAKKNRGLPPFASQVITIESESAQLITLETARGVALAEWRGAWPDVLDLIEVALPQSWGLNAPSNSPIFNEIRKRGYFYTPLPCAERMVNDLGGGVSIPYISVLDRI